MDQGRLSDLARLQAIIDNPFKSRFARRMAAKNKHQIVEQLKDKRLAGLRRAMILAAQHGDNYNEWKLANQIKDYQKQERIED